MRVSDTLAFAAGHWRIERVLADHRSGTQGRFTGSATLSEPALGEPALAGPDEPGPARTWPALRWPALRWPALRWPALRWPALCYLETGELRFGTHTGPATRTLRYQGRPDGTVDVRFADGHLFYRLDLRSGRCASVHQCRADRYEITYLVLSEDVMEERWQVRGPGKDYQATATLIRGDH
ncbi:MAG: DUF6314 family protein [Streptosporangiaceae bacterium]